MKWNQFGHIPLMNSEKFRPCNNGTVQLTNLIIKLKWLGHHTLVVNSIFVSRYWDDCLMDAISKVVWVNDTTL